MRLLVEHRPRIAFRHLFLDDELLAVLGVRPVPDFGKFRVVLALVVHDRVQTFVLLQLGGFGELLVAHVRDGQQRADVRARKHFERLRVGDDMHAAAHQQVSDRRARHRVIGGLVGADLARPRAAFQEEVVQQVELEVAAVEHVRARPVMSHRVHG